MDLAYATRSAATQLSGVLSWQCEFPFSCLPEISFVGMMPHLGLFHLQVERTRCPYYHRLALVGKG